MQNLISDIYKGEDSFTSHYNLLSGSSGYLLFLYHNGDYENLYSFISKIVQDLHQNPILYHTYSFGITGLLWVLNYINEDDSINYLDEVIDTLNEFLLQSYDKKLRADLDFLHGFSGIIHYLVDYNYSEDSRNIIINYLDDLANRTFDKNNPTKIKEAFYKDKVLANFGISHGLPAIVQILSRIFKRNIEREKTERLLNAYTDFLLTNKNKKDTNLNCLFPNTFDSKGLPSRLAWCYGDLGVAIALWQAGKNTKNEYLMSESLNVFDFSLSRKSLKENMVSDPMLCHGTTSIATIYNRIWRNTGLEKYLYARDYWLEKTLDFKQFSDGVGGYKNYNPSQNTWGIDYGLLNGALGIALAMMSFKNDSDIRWDRALLIS